MECQIYDDWIDEPYLHEFALSIETSTNWDFNNIANRRSWPHGQKGSHRLSGCNIFKRVGLNRVTHLHPDASKFFDLYESIESILDKKYYLSEIQLNLQHSGCDGSAHVDGIDFGQKTIMLMTNSVWKTEWGGQFQIIDMNDTIMEEHEYVPGRLIVFPASCLHRGLGPNIEYPYVYRHTLVFRVCDIGKEDLYLEGK
tara:strand:- start:1324 stop:1917 length:594 start_codon:yes stop_codon:yes gene_type:complete